jgi:hypothetical protein
VWGMLRTVRAPPTIVPLIAALALAVTGCDDDEADPNEPQEQPVLEVQTNTTEPVCMQVEEDLPPEVENLPIIGCDVAHTHEIFATVESEEQVYPGVDALGEFVQVECLERFEPFVGTSAFDSTLSYTWLVPTLSGWNDEDDREVLCVLMARDGAELVGSMRDTNV